MSELKVDKPRRSWLGRIAWTRLRTCSDCGKVESVRADNTAPRCLSCAAKIRSAKGLVTIKARANKCTCAHCGVEFGRSRSAMRANNFCSIACLRAFKTAPRTCKTCGADFVVSRSVLSGKTNSSGNFCGRPCYVKWMCRTDRETGRGTQWAKARKEALRRQPFCALCGTRRRLQVHHLAPFRLNHDNSQGNLIPLCVTHHKFVECVTNEIEAIGATPEDMTLVMGTLLRMRAVATAGVLRRIASAARHPAKPESAS